MGGTIVTGSWPRYEVLVGDAYQEQHIFWAQRPRSSQAICDAAGSEASEPRASARVPRSRVVEFLT
jgi:hypothetical protein